MNIDVEKAIYYNTAKPFEKYNGMDLDDDFWEKLALELSDKEEEETEHKCHCSKDQVNFRGCVCGGI